MRLLKNTPIHSLTTLKSTIYFCECYVSSQFRVEPRFTINLCTPGLSENMKNKVKEDTNVTIRYNNKNTVVLVRMLGRSN